MKTQSNSKKFLLAVITTSLILMLVNVPRVYGQVQPVLINLTPPTMALTTTPTFSFSVTPTSTITFTSPQQQVTDFLNTYKEIDASRTDKLFNLYIAFLVVLMVSILGVAFMFFRFMSRSSVKALSVQQKEARSLGVSQKAKKSEAQKFSNVTLEKNGLELKTELKVFLCHSRKDQLKVRQLYRRLKRVKGISPWLDVENLLPGAEWDMEIKNAVRDSHVILVCLSKNSTNKEGYVQKEIRQALDVSDEKPEGTIFIIPLRLENCEVPDRLKKWQWLDLFEKESNEKLLIALRKRANDLMTKNTGLQ